MAPTPRPFNVDATLTAISIAYRNPANKLIGKKVLPPLQVMQETFKYTVYPLGEAFTLPDTLVGRKGRPPVLEFSGDEGTDSVADYGMDSEIPYSDIQAAAAARAENRSTYDPEKTAAEQLTNLIELDRERRVAAVVQNAANYAAGRKVTLAGTDQFSDFANSDPVGVIEAGMEGTLVFRPNTICMGRPVWSSLKRHPQLIKAVKGGLSDEGFITRAQFAELFEIDPERFLVGEAWLNSAAKGQDVSLQHVWGKSIQLLYIDGAKGSADDATITWGFTAELGGRIAGAGEDKHIGLQGGKFIRVGERVKEKVVAKDVGYQISAAVA